MFKKTVLTNVRPSKSEEPEVSTTPTTGNVKLNAPAAAKIGVVDGDYVQIVSSSDPGLEGIYIAKGSEGAVTKTDETGKVTEREPNVGAKLASTNGKGGGSLQFSSENAFRELKGNKENKKVYSVSDPIDEDGNAPGEGYTGALYYKLEYVRDEAKLEKKAGEAAGTSNEASAE